MGIQRRYLSGLQEYNRFHSINIPSEWEWQQRLFKGQSLHCFHSINIPSEWELPIPPVPAPAPTPLVSIQLISPASGNPFILTPYWVRSLEPLSEGQQKSPPTSLQNHH